MLYGIIATIDMLISHEAISVTLENVSNRPTTRTPKRPSSTR